MIDGVLDCDEEEKWRKFGLSQVGLESRAITYLRIPDHVQQLNNIRSSSEILQDPVNDERMAG